MKKHEDIFNNLMTNNWPPYASNQFVDDVLFSALLEQVEDDEIVVSQVWGVRLSEQGELTSQYELLTLTDKRLISVYSDIDNDKDKIKVFSQPLVNVYKFSAQPSNLHKGYIRINIILKGTAWALETNDLKTADHFNKSLDRLLIKARQDSEATVMTNLLNDDKSNKSLKTVHADSLKDKKGKKAAKANKHNMEKLKSYAKTNILWFSIALGSAFSLLIIGAMFLGSFNEGTATKAMRIVAGVFGILFGIGATISFLMLTMKVWDKDKFSRNFYRVLWETTLSVGTITFGAMMAASPNGLTGATGALFMIMTSLYLTFDSAYMLVKRTNDLKQAK